MTDYTRCTRIRGRDVTGVVLSYVRRAERIVVVRHELRLAEVLVYESVTVDTFTETALAKGGKGPYDEGSDMRYRGLAYKSERI